MLSSAQPLCQLLIDSSTNLHYLLPPWSSSKFDLPFSDISCCKLNFNVWSLLLQITAIQIQCIYFPFNAHFCCLASMNVVYSVPRFKIIIVIKADIPEEIKSFGAYHLVLLEKNTSMYQTSCADVSLILVWKISTALRQFSCINQCCHNCPFQIIKSSYSMEMYELYLIFKHFFPP